MTDESSPAATVAPPIAIVAQAALEDIRAALPASHKQLLLVQHDGYLVVAASRGHSEEDAIYGESLALGDGFLGWAAETGEPQIRANLQYVPPETPGLTSIEKRLQAKSAIGAPVDLGGFGFAMMAAYVCHGFNVFMLEDLDKLVEAAGEWADRLGEAVSEPESQQWLAQQTPAPPAPEESSDARDAVDGEPAQPTDDYTAQDVEVLLSVFGVDLTTKDRALARVLKADVGEVLRRDVRDVFKPATETGADTSAVPEQVDGAGAPDPEHLTKDDVGRVLSVFGVRVKTGDSPFARALSQDVGSLLKGERSGGGRSDEPAPDED